MADMQGFRQMISERAESPKGLPQVCLKETSDFDMALSRLVMVDNRKDGETDAQVTQRYVDELCASLCEEVNKPIADQFNAVIDVFKEKISAATKSLEEIRASAKQLAGYMEQGKDDLLARDPFVSTHLNLTKLSVDFPEWTWEGSKVFGSKTYLVERVNSQFIAEGAEVPSDYDYRLFMLGMSTVARHLNFAVLDNFPAEVKTTLVDQLVEAVGASVTKENIAVVVDLLTGTTRMTGIVNDLQRINSMSPADLFERIKEYDELIRKFFPVADAIVSKTVALPELESSDAFKTNAELMVKLCEYLAYFEAMERETVYKDTVLLQGGLINADNKTSFEEAGGTQLMLAHYIRYMYKDDVAKIPARGISSKVIIESAAHNEKVVKADMCNITNRIVLATTNAKVSTFTTVAHRYIVNKVDREMAEGTPVDKTVAVDRLMTTVAKKVAIRIRQNDIAFTDAALMLIVETDYAGTFVEQMYNELGAAYLAKMETAEGEVTDMELRVAEMSVIARMVANFVVDQMVEPCCCKELCNTAPVVPVNGDAV